MNKMDFLRQRVTTKMGKKWLETAGPWADEPIEPFSLAKAREFVVQEVWVHDCNIDPCNIAGTDHAAYNRGMTWREFLGAGKRMSVKLDVLETKSEYYSDPKKYATDSEPWGFYDFNGKLYVSIGNHRSVVAKFRAHEEGNNVQRVWWVVHLTVSEDAKRAYKELQNQYLPEERDFGPERELVSETDGTYEYKIFVRCWLHNWKGGDLHTLPIQDAVAFVRNKNQIPKRIFQFFPKLWKRVYLS